ncbi:hypothetical protein SAMN05660473_04221 [Arthrobacter sp. 49Tsu3.1M3]|uniref:hypothetical protein n=1 Tax=Arthrobacter sp. 49Tsu3.1M3 TaxID=1279029 RepID=UPI0009A6FFB1|nr:hypothetical protein [Arthrobacter sp. 49Tsu3.1M3]SKC11168.1 hypothetical protein SAMN05660473_04221 [Arthrobacter sp. 49Tsu3.1M3]
MTALLTQTSSPDVMATVASAGRFREWVVTLAPTHKVPALHKGTPFTADLAIVRISAAGEDEPFTALRVDLVGNAKKTRLSRQFRNDVANPSLSILAAPAWVRDLFVNVTGAPELVNAYAGPELGAAAYVEHTTPDVRFPAPDAQDQQQS